MANELKKGDSVRQVVKAIEGTIAGLTIVDDEVKYKVTYTDEKGEPHERVFAAGEIEKKE